MDVEVGDGAGLQVRVERQEHGVELEALDGRDQDLRVGVARDPEEPDHPLVPGLHHRLDRPTLVEDLVHLGHEGQVVDLPEVDVVRVK